MVEADAARQGVKSIGVKRIGVGAGIGVVVGLWLRHDGRGRQLIADFDVWVLREHSATFGGQFGP